MNEYRLTNQNISAVILPQKGGTVKSLCKDGIEFLYTDEENLASNERPRCGIPFLFPICGLLRDGVYQVGQKQYAMGIHGFAHTSSMKVVENDDTSLTLCLESNSDILEIYPFPCRIWLYYTLTEDALQIRQRYENIGKNAMPFAYGFHPYFKVENSNDARITIQAAAQLDYSQKRLIPFGNGTVTLSLSQGAPEAGLAFEQVTSPAVLQFTSKNARVILSFDTSFTHLILWTVRNKKFICVEPWNGTANGLNTGDYRLLAPGKVWDAMFSIRIEDGIAT